MKQVNDLTYGELKARGKALGVRVIGLGLDAMRTAVTDAEKAAADKAAAKLAPRKPRAKTKPLPGDDVKTKIAPDETQTAPPIEAPATIPAEAEDALNDVLVSETVIKLEIEKEHIKDQIAALKKQTKVINDAEKQIIKAEKEALKLVEKEKVKADREQAKKDKAAQIVADREKAKKEKEKELAVHYNIGDRVKVEKGDKLVTADVIAADIYDSRSGFSFYRFRRVLIDPTDQSEVPGAYFFKRNYTIPQRAATDKDLPAPTIIAD